MRQLSILVLTNHTSHKSYFGLYPLLRMMAEHECCAKIAVASLALEGNVDFVNQRSTTVAVSDVDDSFVYSEGGDFYHHKSYQADLSDFDFVLIRSGHKPYLTHAFVTFLEDNMPEGCVMNRPSGVFETGTKAYLENFKELCAPSKLCSTVGDVKAFLEATDAVLKPLRESGGDGIIKVEGGVCMEGQKSFSMDELFQRLDKYFATGEQYLAVTFLKNVYAGDKRLVVVNGKIVGWALRKGADGNWLCNISGGGSAHPCDVEPGDQHIVDIVDPVLRRKGVIMYGVDTLTGNDGERILSELNTANVGILSECEEHCDEPVFENISNGLWQYMQKNSA